MHLGILVAAALAASAAVSHPHGLVNNATENGGILPGAYVVQFAPGYVSPATP